MVSSLIAPLLAACLFFLFPASVVPTAIVDLDITLTGNSTDEPFLQRRRGGPWDRNCAGSGNCDGLRKNDGGANWCIRAMSGYKSDRRYNRYSSSIFQGTEDEHGGGCTLMFNCQDSAEFDRGVMGAEIMETLNQMWWGPQGCDPCGSRRIPSTKSCAVTANACDHCHNVNLDP